MSFRLSDRPDVIKTRFGLPHPQWDQVAAIAGALEDWSDAEFIADWLGMLAEALGADYRSLGGPDLAIVAARDQPDLERFHAECRRRLARIRGMLLPPDYEPEHPDVLIEFADQNRYYDYISASYSSGRHTTSVGIHIRTFIPHVVINHQPGWSRSSTITHELVHQVLSGLDSPRWLEEGLAEYISQMLQGWDWFSLTREDVASHAALWNEIGLQGFWTGHTFGGPDDRSKLSYQLAEILVRLIISDQPRQLREFVRRAKAADAGQQAAIEVLGKTLIELAAQFLGQGNWEHKRESRASELRLRRRRFR